MSIISDIFSYFSNLNWKGRDVLPEPAIPPPEKNLKEENIPLPSGRVSVPSDSDSIYLGLKKTLQEEFIRASFRQEIIHLIRDLYRVNPDVSIAVQDMFKLSNTGHKINFPNNTEAEAIRMRKHLEKVSKKWVTNSAGTFGITNRLFVQLLVSGAVSVEAVPNDDLSGVKTILLVNPETIVFKRERSGQYSAYQRNLNWLKKYTKDHLIKLNPNTYIYSGMYNDTDEPYGIPPFMSALDSLKTQADLRINFKNIVEMVGGYGYVSALMQKPQQMTGRESDGQYSARLERLLRELSVRTKQSLKDGVVAGFIDDHEIKVESTVKDLGNMDIPWRMNQQSVANGLGVNGTIIGVDTGSKTEGGTSILFSKLLSQLENAQQVVAYVWQFIYDLELRLAGFNNKGTLVEFYPSTATDDLKIQQGKEYKIRNLVEEYKMGIISLEQMAYELGRSEPDQKVPRVPLNDMEGKSTAEKEADREKDKDKSDRKTRDKNKTVTKRRDGDTRER